MQIVVTGASGFLGRSLLEHLRKQHRDASLVASVRRVPEVRVPGVEYRAGFPDGDLVFHLAGSKGIGPSLGDPHGDLAANVDTTIAALEACRGRMVLASSCAVYGDVPMPATEDGPVRPMSPYGVSKLAAEQYALMYHRARGTDVRIARIGNPYGPGQRRLVVYDLARRALRGGPLSIHGDGAAVRDFIHVDDVAAALATIAAAGDPGGTYNVASGEPTTILQLAKLIAAAAGASGGVEPDGRAEAGKVPVFLPSVARLRSLGFEPARGLEEGIHETVGWIARNT